ncbi:MazG-related protein [Marinomonas transparens]|uniref:MazG-related protein n=1 Tax=Marinomonas transparens TaxID=2795388 RepID=A0A934N0G3_9GAMM|nr:MazG-related protein [Marinomonas transparens]MBJ7538540.1 MazG-related protein [Marinomonas transparens]
MSKKVLTALVWIKQILEEADIPYQIVGGLAASIHGGKRPVADIDLYIPRELSRVVLPKVESFISKPLKHCVEYGWDVEYFQLIYQEQKIEIGLSSGTKILNGASGEWFELNINYDHSTTGDYQGVALPVIPISELIAYKSILGREVDLIDIEEITDTRP